METAIATSGRIELEKCAAGVLGHAVLLERARRVAALGDWIAGFDAFRTIACSRDAVSAACFFVDSWCAADVRAGRFDPYSLPIVTPTEQHADAAADVAAVALGNVVDGVTGELAVSSIRLSASRAMRMPEAQVVAEAVGVDSIGPVWLSAQVSRCATEGRPLVSIVHQWRRQQDYQYWPGRIEETLRFEASRALARQRLEVLGAQINALETQLRGGDWLEAESNR
ncbi:MAG: hypothetical protein HZA51_07685 [Planctomycetes bacterium]|nr:hypothetical protein [Planctomycetota bacterium]